MKYVRALVLIGFLAMICQAEAQASIMLWNKLGSDAEVENSEIGPNGRIHRGPISYIRGQFGNGFRSKDGRGKSGVYFGPWENINSYYDEAGTVEFWWRTPRDYDEPHSTPDELFVSATWDSPFPVPFQLMYRWRDHNGIGGFEFRIEREAGGQSVLRTGKVAPFETGQWVHVAFVWDINGLPDHPEVWYGTYIDGQYYPLIDVKDQGGSINYRMKRESGDYLSMGYYDGDSNNQQNGVIDNVVIWDEALVDFSHRFIEEPSGERSVYTGELEIGEVEVDHQPVRIEFGRPFDKPIVVAHMTTRNGWDPCVVRIDGVDQEGFTVQVQEYEYLDGYHPNKETITYLVMEQGVVDLPDGSQIEALTFFSNSRSRSGHPPYPVKFLTTFASPPVVMTSIVSKNDGQTVTGRISNIDTNGFDYQFQEQEANLDGHEIEEVHYIAWEPGRGEAETTDSEGNTTTTLYDVGIVSAEVAHWPTSVAFEPLSQDRPFLLADMQSANGPDTATLAVRRDADDWMKVWVEEETSADEETLHMFERVGFIRVQAE